MKNTSIIFHTKKECYDLLRTIDKVFPEVKWIEGQKVSEYDIYKENNYNPNNETRYINIINNKLTANAQIRFNIELYTCEEFLDEFSKDSLKFGYKKVLDYTNIQDSLR